MDVELPWFKGQMGGKPIDPGSRAREGFTEPYDPVVNTKLTGVYKRKFCEHNSRQDLLILGDISLQVMPVTSGESPRRLPPDHYLYTRLRDVKKVVVEEFKGAIDRLADKDRPFVPAL